LAAAEMIAARLVARRRGARILVDFEDADLTDMGSREKMVATECNPNGGLPLDYYL
jgi:hypothetical protein